MAFALKIATDNAAFRGSYGNEHNAACRTEIVVILEEIAERIGQGAMSGNIRDSNGNLVGKFTIDEITDD